MCDQCIPRAWRVTGVVRVVHEVTAPDVETARRIGMQRGLNRVEGQLMASWPEDWEVEEVGNAEVGRGPAAI